MSFWYHCKAHTFTLIWSQHQFILKLITFWDTTICVKDLTLFLWKCDFETSVFKASYSFGFDRLHKMHNFLWENVWKSVRNYNEVIDNILSYIQKNLKINRWVIFHPYAIFNCPYLKTGLCGLFPVLLECITYTLHTHPLCLHDRDIDTVH